MKTKIKIFCFCCNFILITAANVHGQNTHINYSAAYNAVNNVDYSNHQTSLFNNFSPQTVNVNSPGSPNGYSVTNPQNQEFGIDYDVSSRAYYDQMFMGLNVSENEVNSLLDYYKYKKRAHSKHVKSYDEWFAEQTTPEERKAAKYILDHFDYKDTRDYAPLNLRMGFKYNPPKALDKEQLMFSSVFGYLLLSNYKNFRIKK